MQTSLKVYGEVMLRYHADLKSAKTALFYQRDLYSRVLPIRNILYTIRLRKSTFILRLIFKQLRTTSAVFATSLIRRQLTRAYR